MRYTVQRIRSSTFRGIRPFCLGKISSKLSTVELMDPERSTVSRAFFMANWREAAAASREDMISQTSFVVKLSSAMGIDEYWWSPLLDGKRVEQIQLHCASWSRRIVNDIKMYIYICIYIMMSFTLYTLSRPLCTIKWNSTVRLWMVSKSQYLLWIQMCKMFSWSVGPSWFLSLSLSSLCALAESLKNCAVGFLSGLDLTICAIFKDAIFIYKSIERAQAKLHSKLLNPPGKPNNLWREVLWFLLPKLA